MTYAGPIRSFLPMARNRKHGPHVRLEGILPSAVEEACRWITTIFRGLWASAVGLNFVVFLGMKERGLQKGMWAEARRDRLAGTYYQTPHFPYSGHSGPFRPKLRAGPEEGWGGRKQAPAS